MEGKSYYNFLQIIFKDISRTIVAIESDQLLLWDLRTQSVIHSVHAPNVFQIFYMNKEALIGVIYRQVDSAEQKIARLTIYSITDFSVQYSFEYPCRLFKECAVMRVSFEI